MKGLSARMRTLGVAVLFWGLYSDALGAETRPGWQLEWEEVVKGAKKEGALAIYGGEEVTHLEVLKAFAKEYPEIKVVTVTGHGSELGSRIIAERRAGKYLVDVYAGGPSTPYRVLYLSKALDPITPVFILPEVTDTSKWYGGKHFYADPEDRYLFLYEGTVAGGGSIYYHTQQVDPKEIQSYWDLLRPKWKGKILFMDPRSSSLGLNAATDLYYNPDLGPQYVRRLFQEMDVGISGDRRQGTNWLGSGKYSLCFACRDIDRAKKQGLPINDIASDQLKEGGGQIGGGSSSVITLLNRAPHPAAAKLFINWYLSRKGQALVQKVVNTMVVEDFDAMRIDIPKNDIIGDGRRLEGRKYQVIGFREPKPVLKLLDELLK